MSSEKPKSLVFNPQVVTDNERVLVEFDLAIKHQENLLKNQDVLVSILTEQYETRIGNSGEVSLRIPFDKEKVKDVNNTENLREFLDENLSVEVLQELMGNKVKVQTLLVTNENESLAPKKKQKLPIGLQHFESLLEDGYMYVDKTKYLYELANNGKIYFLSRPRRFGKSLLITTLDALFQGKKELFQGMDISETDYDFKEHPVIRIDFSPKKVDGREDIEQYIFNQTKDFAKKYNIELEEEKYDERFKELIKKINKKYKTRVVILIDEYDSPILDNLDSDKKIEIRDSLKKFYSVIKSSDEYLRFVFLTGITKFAKMNIFSGLNNLEDITDSEEYSSMLGYTQTELEEYFEEYFPDLEKKLELTREELLDKIKLWYNGYNFSSDGESMYNPFGTMLLLKQKDFKNHWFETGTPTFLIDLIKTGDYNLEDFDGKLVDKESYSSMNIDNLDIVALLIQTGYLTIKSYDKKEEVYTLRYPNYEVKHAFFQYLLSNYSGIELSDTNNRILALRKNLLENDLEAFFETLRGIFKKIPHDIHLKYEKYYQSLFYTIFTMLGYKIKAEVSTNIGTIDVVIELKERIYIIEFKFEKTPEKAITQIHEKKYYEQYEESGKEIVLIGANFEKRNVGEYVSEIRVF